MENNLDLLKKQKIKERNKRYYAANREKIIKRIIENRKNTDELTKAKWCLKYWEKQVKKLELLEQEKKIIEKGE